MDAHRRQKQYEQQLAYRFWQNGQDKAKIARHLNVTAETVTRWIQELEAHRLSRSGYDTAEIARQLNITGETVARWIPRMEQDVLEKDSAVPTEENADIRPN